MRLLAGLLVVLTIGGPAGAQSIVDSPVEKVAGGFKFTEGPAWSPQGALVFSDIPNGRLHKFVPGAGVSVFIEKSGGTNGNAFDAEGRLYSCQGGERRVVRRGGDGAVTVIADHFEGRRLNAPNDITVRRDGHVYFTDPAFGRRDNGRELDFFGVYHVTPQGRIEAVARWSTRPNGIALSPDGAILYVADSDAKLIRAYDLDATGSAADERVLVSGIRGVPDGLRVDRKGKLFLAAAEVVVFAPDGRQIDSIPIPEIPANLGFGDADGRTLYVTARTGLYRVRLAD